jgi:hypothetical protein
VSFDGFSLKSTADDPTDAIHQLLLWKDISQLPRNLLLFRLKYVEEFEKISLTDQCRNNILDSVKQANHADYEKSKPRAVRRKLLQINNATIIAKSKAPLARVTRGTICVSTQCDLCTMVVATAKLIQDVEISDVALAFGGKWSHSKIHEGYLPFGNESCCRDAHGLVPVIKPDYRFKKQKIASIPVPTVSTPSPSYQPLSPVMIDGECMLAESGSAVDVSKQMLDSDDSTSSSPERKKMKGKRKVVPVKEKTMATIKEDEFNDASPPLVPGVKTDTPWDQYIDKEDFC